MQVISSNSPYLIDVMSHSEQLIRYIISHKDANDKFIKDRYKVLTRYNKMFFPERISEKEEDDGYIDEYEEPDLIACSYRVIDLLLEEPALVIDVLLDSREFKNSMLNRKIREH
jgi:hypothetical protein